LNENSFLIVLQPIARKGDLKNLIYFLRLMSEFGYKHDRLTQSAVEKCIINALKFNSKLPVIKNLASNIIEKSHNKIPNKIKFYMLGLEGKFNQAWSLWETMDEQEKDITVMSSALDLCGFSNDLEKLQQIWDGIIEKGTFMFNSNIWNSLFEALIRCGKDDIARFQFENFLKLRLPLSTKTIGTILHPNLCKRNPKLAREIEESIKSYENMLE
jgi:hypothetical protein